MCRSIATCSATSGSYSPSGAPRGSTASCCDSRLRRHCSHSSRAARSETPPKPPPYPPYPPALSAVAMLSSVSAIPCVDVPPPRACRAAATSAKGSSHGVLIPSVMLTSDARPPAPSRSVPHSRSCRSAPSSAPLASGGRLTICASSDCCAPPTVRLSAAKEPASRRPSKRSALAKAPWQAPPSPARTPPPPPPPSSRPGSDASHISSSSKATPDPVGTRTSVHSPSRHAISACPSATDCQSPTPQPAGCGAGATLNAGGAIGSRAELTARTSA